MENGTPVGNVENGPVYRMATVEDVKAYFDAGFTCIGGDDADYLTYRAIGHAVGDGYSETDENGNYKNTDGIKLLNLVKEYCDTYGVAYENAKVFVKLGYLEGAMEGNAIHSETQTKANVTKFYNHLKTFPCFGGFILRDEPRGYMAETYNKWYKWLVNDLGVYRDGYSLHGALLGMNAAEVHVAGSSDNDTDYSTTLGLTAEQYRTYLDKYIGGLTGSANEYLSFDYYPFTETITRTRSGSILNYNYSYETTYGLKGQYFQNLEEFATASEKYGFKRGLCLQSTAFYNKSLYEAIKGKGSDDSYTYSGKISEEMTSYQLYTALAYGFDRIAYFTYMQPFNQTTAEYYDNSPYMWSKQSDGTYKAVATDVYESIKAANAEIVDLYKRINGFSWLGTAYSSGTVATANVFSGTTSYSCDAINSLSSSYDVIAGCMKDINGRYGFMAVNSDDPRNGRTNSVTLTFGNGYNKVYYYENGVRKSATLIDGKFTVSLGAGKGVFVVPEHAETKKLTLPSADKDGTVYPYTDEAKSYLEIEDADVADYISGSDDAVGAVVVSWNGLFDGATSFRLEYSVNEDFSLSKRKDMPPVTDELYKCGYPFFKGEITLAGKIKKFEKGRTAIKLSGRFMTAKVTANGKEKLLTLDDKGDITDILKDGENEITVTLKSSMRNLFGPHHFKPVPEPMSVSPYHFEFRGGWIGGKTPVDYTDEYNFVPFGANKIYLINTLDGE